MMQDGYPFTPGHRGVDTSIEAAEHVSGFVPSLRARVLAVIEAAGAAGATGDEIAETLDVERFAVRPRTSELRSAGRIIDSGQRRDNRRGRRMIAWCLPQFGEVRS